MAEYGKILVIAMPIFLTLIFIEKIYGLIIKNDTVPLIDTLSSLSSGLINTLKDILGMSINVLSYEFLVHHLAITHLKTNIYTYIITFIVIDFYGYCSHRWAHKINILWNSHAIHHSSEEFNLACALRQPFAVIFKFYSFLLLPAALLGIDPKVIATTMPIHLFLQFWYHTRHIQKMGVLEHILVTPSHHRVHHAINPEYMDKNFSQIFIVWDKFFGTFQEELVHIPAVYGITRPANTWNPFWINFQHLWLLIQDAWRAPSWKDTFLIWFKPTGWRPANFDELYPIQKIHDIYNFKKYNTYYSNKLVVWSFLQIIFILSISSYLYYFISEIGHTNIYIYGIFIFISIYSYTELLNCNKRVLFPEILKFVLGIYVLILNKSWFAAEKYFEYATQFMYLYLIISLGATLYFVWNNFEKPNDENY